MQIAQITQKWSNSTKVAQTALKETQIVLKFKQCKVGKVTQIAPESLPCLLSTLYSTNSRKDYAFYLS